MQHIRKYVNADQIPAFPVSAEMKSRIGDSVSQSPDCFFLEIEYIEDGGQVCGYRLECEDPKFSYDVSDFQGSQIHRMEGYMGWTTRQSVSPFDPHDSKTSFIGGYFADPIHRASYWPLGLRAISVLYLHEVPDQVPFGICRDITNHWGYIECHGKIPTTMEGLSKLKLRLRLRLTNGTLTEAIPVWINPMEYSSLAIISPVENIP
ncbi:MAG: hypothetical protein PHE53_10725 [Thermoguttaceae bacterium]|nr:hypothetical protein [Thermoguttaceae bacterium]